MCDDTRVGVEEENVFFQFFSDSDLGVEEVLAGSTPTSSSRQCASTTQIPNQEMSLDHLSDHLLDIIKYGFVTVSECTLPLLGANVHNPLQNWICNPTISSLERPYNPIFLWRGTCNYYYYYIVGTRYYKPYEF